MAPLQGRGAGTSDVQSLPAVDDCEQRFDPETPLSLSAPSLDAVPALILDLLGRTEPSLSPIEQRVLRACLRLAGERLPMVGGLDADFYEALLAFKARHGLEPLDARLDLPTLTAIVQQASRAVGGPYGAKPRLLRGVWFDVFRAPALIAEVPGIVSLIRELKGGRTRRPVLQRATGA